MVRIRQWTWVTVTVGLASGALLSQPLHAQTVRPNGAVNRPPGSAMRLPSQQRPTGPNFVRGDVDTDADLNAQIVARVDDTVILLADVIEPVKPMLEQQRARLKPDEYRKLEWQLLKQVTESRIERTIVLNELKLRVPDPSVLVAVRAQANDDFEKYVKTPITKNGFKNFEELEAQLDKEGASIEKLRSEFVENTLAQQFLNQLVRSKGSEPTRAELLRYYRDNPQDFAEPEGVVWSQIQVSFGADRNAAKQKVEEAERKLKAGGDFAEIARKYSDSPTAIDGGAWSLTSRGSYADPKIDDALFTYPVGQVSNVIEGATAFHIIRIDKRSDGSPTPFVEVQDKIRDILVRQGRVDLRAEKLEEIKARHYVESIFDENPNDLMQANKKLQSFK